MEEINRQIEMQDCLLDPPSTAIIQEIEKQTGFALPEPYLNFVKKNHGGYPSPDVFSYGSSGRSILQHFLEFAENTTYSILNYMVLYQARLPRGFLPIACDPGGNLILMGLCDNERERIYFWDHEKELHGNELDLIAKSFDEFVCSFSAE